jgi:nucleolar protein 14
LVQEDEDEETPWLSAGTFLLLKASTAIFPATDRTHYIVTPVSLFLGQILAQTPILSVHDAVMGTLCAGLLIDNGLEAKRVAPEALGFLSGIVRVLSNNPFQFALPAFESAYNLADIQALRDSLRIEKGNTIDLPKLKLEAEFIGSTDGKVAVALLSFCFHIVGKLVANSLQGSISLGSETDLFAEMSDSLLTLRPKDIPQVLREKLSATASQLAALCQTARQPLRRKTDALKDSSGIKTLAPRMEDPERYSMSKDSGKKSVQVAIDRTRREYKREHKAVSRELRTDGAFIESERRKEREAQDSKARAKRQKNFAWLEGEAATLNQQVALGGGLLKGGGIGAAKAKARSGKLGIKKGGKF